jgi:hypothetical protein
LAAEPLGGPAGKRFEAPAGVPVGGALVEGVDDHRPDGKVLVYAPPGRNEDAYQDQPDAYFAAILAFLADQPIPNQWTGIRVPTRMGGPP